MLRLTDKQCRACIKPLREFGYPSLTYDKVREAADAIADGTDSDTNVIHVLLKGIIKDIEDEAAV